MARPWAAPLTGVATPRRAKECAAVPLTDTVVVVVVIGSSAGGSDIVYRFFYSKQKKKSVLSCNGRWKPGHRILHRCPQTGNRIGSKRLHLNEIKLTRSNFGSRWLRSKSKMAGFRVHSSARQLSRGKWRGSRLTEIITAKANRQQQYQRHRRRKQQQQQRRRRRRREGKNIGK